MKIGDVLPLAQCNNCGRYDTLIVVNFYPADRVDPESASGYCRSCDEPWEY